MSVSPSSTSASTTSSFRSPPPGPSPATTSVVVYQKVVRSPPKSDPSLLLGLLLEYLQDDFCLPDRLPMIYQTAEDDAAASSWLGPDQHEPVLVWNSPLSPDPQATALYVNIVAINSQPTSSSNSSTNSSNSSTNSTASPTNMVLVVVEKNGASGKRIPPMLMNLFAASEKQIIRALDRGLDEFIRTSTYHSRRNRAAAIGNSPQPNNRRRGTYDNTLTPQENAMMVASQLYNDDTESFNNNNENDNSINTDDTSNRNVRSLNDHKSRILEADIIQRNGVNVRTETDIHDTTSQPPQNEQLSTEQQKRQRQQAAALESMKYNATTDGKTSQPAQSVATNETEEDEESGTTSASPVGLDFAVWAAKMALAKRNKVPPEPGTIQIPRDDYAVQQAAKVRAARRSQQEVSSIHSSNDYNNNNIENSHGTTDPMQQSVTAMQQPRSPMLEDALSRRKSRAFMTTISTPSDYKHHNNNVPHKNNQTNTTSTATKLRNNDGNVNDIEPVLNESSCDRQPQPTSIQNKTLNLNVRVNEKEPSETLELPTSEKMSSNTVKDEIYDLTQMAFDEMIEQNSDDMTPEEILARVMKYGVEQEWNERDGAGFVSAAFDKAKSLLREQNERRELRLRQQRQQESQKITGITSSDEPTPAETLSPSEELRRMFTAGESIAERCITTTTATSSSTMSLGRTRSTTEQDIDALIESEKTVTRHARVLDDELTELMVRINNSPTEGSDGVGRYQFFDVLSGPEVYDQNVDPLTAVNWPGALPGTKTVRLPKALDEAVRQAKFAAGVLTNVEEVESKDGMKSYRLGKRELSTQQLSNLQGVVKEAVEIGLIDDPLLLQQEEARLQMLLDELAHQPDERMREVASNYKDLLLSDNFIDLMKKRLNEMTERDLDALRQDDDSLKDIHARERELLGQLVVYAQLLLKEVQALGAELESQQLEVIRSICKVAMDPAHRTEEETAMALSDAVRDMRPLFDDGFIAYLKYAVSEEEGRLARAGLLHDPEYNQWLFVLKIVQQGVHAEIAKGINRYLEHIWYILRMETPAERRMLLEKLVDVMPTLDVRPFVQVVENIVGALGDAVRGEFDEGTVLGEMTNKLLQLHRDVKDVLPNDRIAKMSRDADEWAAKQKQRLLEQRNLTKQRLKAAQDTEHLDSEIEEFGKRGEVERFD